VSEIPDEARNARERLFDAALEMFSTRGFYGTTTREIASRAGLSPAAMYVHYRTKEDLLFAISKTGHEWSLGVVRAAASTSADPVAQLAAVVHDFTLEHAENKARARVVNYELEALSAEHRSEIVAIRREIEQVFRGVLQAGVKAGSFRVDNVAMTARAVIISLGIDTARWFSPGGAWTAEETACHHAQAALRMVGFDGDYGSQAGRPGDIPPRALPVYSRDR
jgi:AcrR family transcriptional regulator